MEIIYCGEARAAEFEYALVRVLPVRLLTTRAASEDEFLAALGKATRRNDFIVIIGALGERSFPEYLARVTGYGCVPASRLREIDPDDDRPLPEGSLPLVDGGRLCGFTMESPSQSITVLSGDKSRRVAVIPALLSYFKARFGEIERFRGSGPSAPTEESDILSKHKKKTLASDAAEQTATAAATEEERKGPAASEPAEPEDKPEELKPEKSGGETEEQAGQAETAPEQSPEPADESPAKPTRADKKAAKEAAKREKLAAKVKAEEDERASKEAAKQEKQAAKVKAEEDKRAAKEAAKQEKQAAKQSVIEEKRAAKEAAVAEELARKEAAKAERQAAKEQKRSAKSGGEIKEEQQTQADADVISRPAKKASIEPPTGQPAEQSAEQPVEPPVSRAFEDLPAVDVGPGVIAELSLDELPELVEDEETGAGEVLTLKGSERPMLVDDEEAPLPLPVVRRRFLRDKLKFIIPVAAGAAVLVLIAVLSIRALSNRPKTIAPPGIERLNEIYSKSGLTAIAGLDENVVGWLKLDGISVPVAYAPGGEAAYRDTLPGGAGYSKGTPLASRDLVNLEGYYTVQMDGYFDTLSEFLDENFAQRGREVKLDSTQFNGSWQLFSAFRAERASVSIVTPGGESSAPGEQAGEGSVESGSASSEVATFSTPGEYAAVLQELINRSSVRFHSTVSASDTVTVFYARRGEQIAVAAACLVTRSPVREETPTESGVSSYAPAIPYLAEDDDFPLDSDRQFVLSPEPLTNDEVNGNLDFPGANSGEESVPGSVSSREMAVTVLSNGVNIRASAGVKGKQLGIANLGDCYPFLSERDIDGEIWYSFRYKDNKVGWVSQLYSVKTTADKAPTHQNIATGNIILTVDNNGTVRSGAALDIVAAIVEAEMSSSSAMEALKAQAVATYSFLLTRGAARGVPVPVAMRVPYERAKQAARAVIGQCAYYGGQVAQTYYFAMSAGVTANPEDIWVSQVPYLKSVPSPLDAEEQSFSTKKLFTSAELRETLAAAYGSSISFGADKSEWINLAYDANNTYVKSARIGAGTVKGSDLSYKLGLRSPAFTVEYDAESDVFTFRVRGYGHGVGMSQVGANRYAAQGWDYKRILEHYFPGVTVQ